MNYYLFFGLFFLTSLLCAQSVGFEARTNGNSYFSFFYKGFESRHRTRLDENRFTYRLNLTVNQRMVISIPLHHKLEKSQTTLEPRLIINFEKYKLWVQKEFWFNEPMNTAFAIDYKIKKITYRFGWDTSNTFRCRLKYKFGK
jgi:hypothetical protein